MSAKEDTKVDRWVKWFKNHPVFAPIIFGGMVITIVGGFLVMLNKDFREMIFTTSFTTESVEIVEQSFERVIKDHPDHTERLEILKGLYVDLARREFQAGKYFAPDVKRYFTVENLRPCQLDSFFVLNTEDFQDPRSDIDPESFVFSEDSEGNPIITFWQQFSCFRAKKSKYQSCSVFTKIIFDRADRIIYLNDEKIEELVFTEERDD
jgi:hypothetical protein